MNALESNRYTDAWRDLAASLPRPRAILAVSAHWYTNATTVTAMDRPRTIHDFFGFPEELFAFEYSCPGSLEVAQEVAAVEAPRWVGLDQDSWGVDHGTWSVLAHMYPEADIPVVQLAINGLEPLEYHFDVGRRLAPLRERGVLVWPAATWCTTWVSWTVPSGWRLRLGAALRRRSPGLGGGVAWRRGLAAEHPDYPLAVPTPDHFIPLVYFAAAAARSERVRPLSWTGTPTVRCP